MTEAEKPDLTSLTVQLLSAYVSNNTLESGELAGLIQSTRAALSGNQPAAEPAPPEFVPATTARKSLSSRDHIISMIDGKPYKTLKRHLSTHGLTPAEYRERYKLPRDYPMVASGYSEHRREVAQRLGLGRKKADAPATADTTATEAAPAGSPEEPSINAQSSGAPNLSSPAPAPLDSGVAPTKGAKRATPVKAATASAPQKAAKTAPQGKSGAVQGAATKDGAPEQAIETAGGTDGQVAGSALVSDAAKVKAPASRKAKSAAKVTDAAVASPDKPVRAAKRASAKAKVPSVTAKGKTAAAPKRNAKAAKPTPEGETEVADATAAEPTI